MTIPTSLTASRLRILLMATLALILLIGGGLFYLAYSKLNQSATETGDKVAEARESQDTLQRLQTLKEDLETEKDTVFMTSQVVADSQNYAYQVHLEI